MKLRLCAAVFLCLACAAADAADEQSFLDAAIDRANLQLDQAERAFALARQSVSAKPAPGHYTAARMSRSQLELIAFYQKNVVATRQVLVGMVQRKRLVAARDALTLEAPASRP